MTVPKIKAALVGLLPVVAFAAVGVVLVHLAAESPTKRYFHIRARQYAFDPSRIVVNRGDEVHIRLSSEDVVHGFYLEGHDLNALIEPGKASFKVGHPSSGGEMTPTEEIVFTAGRPGKYRYRCSHTCGTLHPFMLGEMIVRPNYPYATAMGATVGLLIAAVAISFLVRGDDSRREATDEEGVPR